LGKVQPCSPNLWDMKSPETITFLEKLQQRTDLLYQLLNSNQLTGLNWRFIMNRQGQLLSSQVSGMYTSTRELETAIAKYKSDLKLPFLPVPFRDSAACFVRSQETVALSTPRIGKKQPEKYGYFKIENPEEFIISPQFAQARPFQDGLAAVAMPEKDNPEKLKWHFINSSGQKVGQDYDAVKDFSKGFAEVSNGESPHILRGLIDTTGREIISPQYAEINRMQGDYFRIALQKEGATKGFLYGLSDLTGKVVIPVNYDAIRGISDKTAIIEQNAKIGYIDLSSGHVIFEPRYLLHADPFSSNVAVIVDGDQQSLVIDKTGQVIIGPTKMKVNPFSEDLAVVQEITEDANTASSALSPERKVWVFGMKPDEYRTQTIPLNFHFLDSSSAFGYMDKTGKLVIQPRFSLAQNFKDGVAIVGIKKSNSSDQSLNAFSYGLINKMGQFLVEPQYSYIEPFNEGLAVIRLKDTAQTKLGLINTQGKLVVAPHYSSISSFSEGLARVSETTFDSAGQPLLEQYGYIDKTGKVVIPLLFKSASMFINGHATAHFLVPPDAESAQTVEIDTKGKVVKKVGTIFDYFYRPELMNTLLPATENTRQSTVPLYQWKCFEDHKKAIEEKILKNWHSPISSNETPLQVRYGFAMDMKGTIQKIKLMSSSGVDSLDQSALDAINHSVPFALTSKVNFKNLFNVQVTFVLHNGQTPKRVKADFLAAFPSEPSSSIRPRVRTLPPPNLKPLITPGLGQ
jgi:WG containing repeat/TonB C terminal